MKKKVHSRVSKSRIKCPTARLNYSSFWASRVFDKIIQLLSWVVCFKIQLALVKTIRVTAIPNRKKTAWIPILKFHFGISSHGPTNWKSWKQALGSLCGSGRVWWKMKNCILSLALSGQIFWLPQFLIFWLWEAP